MTRGKSGRNFEKSPAGFGWEQTHSREVKRKIPEEGRTAARQSAGDPSRERWGPQGCSTRPKAITGLRVPVPRRRAACSDIGGRAKRARRHPQSVVRTRRLAGRTSRVPAPGRCGECFLAFRSIPRVRLSKYTWQFPSPIPTYRFQPPLKIDPKPHFAISPKYWFCRLLFRRSGTDLEPAQ